MKRTLLLLLAVATAALPSVGRAEEEEKVIRLGMTGLDTSYVIAFTSYLYDPKNKTRCRVVAGYPGDLEVDRTSTRLTMNVQSEAEEVSTNRITGIAITLLVTFLAGPPSGVGQQPEQSDLDQFFHPPAEADPRGNLMGGWAHARDLVYVSPLVQNYHTREKIYGAFRLAEGIKTPIDHGACACYLHGSRSDGAVAREDFDQIEQGLELIRRSGLPAGFGAHRLHTVKTCVERGYKPDFWMKTLHHTDYWSAQHPTERKNIWCREPNETAAFMGGLEQPWIAFKTLAAGAIQPNVGFKYAFDNGADFICVGMFDFQIVQDANTARDVLSSKLNRQRKWFG